MAFIKIPGIKGLVYVPEKERRARKHNCIDCYSCQMCGNIRCESCRGEKGKQCRK